MKYKLGHLYQIEDKNNRANDNQFAIWETSQLGQGTENKPTGTVNYRETILLLEVSEKHIGFNEVSCRIKMISRGKIGWFLFEEDYEEMILVEE